MEWLPHMRLRAWGVWRRSGLGVCVGGGEGGMQFVSGRGALHVCCLAVCEATGAACMIMQRAGTVVGRLGVAAGC